MDMLNKEQIEANRKYIIDRLMETGRDGMELLVSQMDFMGFFRSPASTKYHGCYEGGLAHHSLNVFGKFVQLTSECGVEVPADSTSIACLLHDVCKAGAYIGLPIADCRLGIEGGTTYIFNKEHPKGHARLSIARVKKYIKLTALEELMILYHMGVYGLEEFDEKKGEYPLRGGGMANAWHHHPAVKLMYFADELATLEEKVEDGRETQNSEPRTSNVELRTEELGKPEVGAA